MAKGNGDFVMAVLDAKQRFITSFRDFVDRQGVGNDLHREAAVRVTAGVGCVVRHGVLAFMRNENSGISLTRC